MPTIYDDAFAVLYERYFGDFMRRFAPRAVAHLGTLPVQEGAVLDLCCGTGETALALVGAGYRRIVGADLSDGMLARARSRLADPIAEGRVELIKADATAVSATEPLGACLCLDGALNHLDDLEALRRCFRAVHAALPPGAPFLFDLLEAARFRQWHDVSVTDEPDAIFIRRGVFDEAAGLALTRVSGAVGPGPMALRVDQTLRSLVFAEADVLSALELAGFRPEPCPLAEEEAPLRTVYQAIRKA